jgi:hypothetical protein
MAMTDQLENKESAARLQEAFLHSLEDSRCAVRPFRHWLLREVLPEAAAKAIVALPFAPAMIGDTRGKRETHNSSRIFFSGEVLERFDACRDSAVLWQDPETVRRVEEICGRPLRGSYLRIEYCQDTDGFWLEPHTDIGAKLFTMLVYLSEGPGAEEWGTDVYDADLNLVARAPCDFNSGLIFLPGATTWHGFRKRPIAGVRRTLIVNYVKAEWRDRFQLAWPSRPVQC